MTWTPERRARQRELIKTWRPWLATTGPKTVAGKAKSARNALKHGTRSATAIAEFRQLRDALSRCRTSTESLSVRVSTRFDQR